MSTPIVQVSVPKSDKKINVPTGLFINNEFVPSVDSQEKIKCVPILQCYLGTDVDRRIALGEPMPHSPGR